MTLMQRIHQAFSAPDAVPLEEQRALFFEVRDALERGALRAAERVAGRWQVNSHVKEAILLGFRAGALADAGSGGAGERFFDKDTMGVRRFGVADRVRLVPGGSAVRRGAYVAEGVTVMPPAYVNIGAYVDRDTMIDSHALVGSCAQIGQRVHLSAGAQIGGVLEPVGLLPVVIEDDVLVGGNCGVYEGVIVHAGAVLATGCILNASTAVYDLTQERVLRASAGAPLEIPERAVVVPGARPLAGTFAQSHGLCLQTPIIIKIRDQRTAGRTALEQALRDAVV